MSWFSPALGRDMEILAFGESGQPIIVFPTSKGRFFDYENQGMIDAIGDRYRNGGRQAFCLDSVDAESWYNRSIEPAQRVLRHISYEHYVIDEVLPMIQLRSPGARVLATGCSFGGYHSANIALRHPDRFCGFVSMGGAFDVKQFLDGYYDDNCYFHNPPDFLPNLDDDWHLTRIRGFQRLVLATGESDICADENLRLSSILSRKWIPHWLDVWGDGTGHDWQWWRQMAVKFL